MGPLQDSRMNFRGPINRSLKGARPGMLKILIYKSEYLNILLRLINL